MYICIKPRCSEDFPIQTSMHSPSSIAMDDTVPGYPETRLEAGHFQRFAIQDHLAAPLRGGGHIKGLSLESLRENGQGCRC